MHKSPLLDLTFNIQLALTVKYDAPAEGMELFSMEFKFVMYTE
jgi:hypothetical protein